MHWFNALKNWYYRVQPNQNECFGMHLTRKPACSHSDPGTSEVTAALCRPESTRPTWLLSTHFSHPYLVASYDTFALTEIHMLNNGFWKIGHGCGYSCCTVLYI